ncbi:MAG: FAD:protein FMN transferase [Oscillospiraceae bacterium]|nr:FAD:protein FMN transferase [Oscillospiraceae bacterium]
MKRLFYVFLMCILLTGCAKEAEPAQQTLFAMDTVMDLRVWGKDADVGIGRIVSTLTTLEANWSATDEKSVLSGINKGQNIVLDVYSSSMLVKADRLSERTGGAFDPRLGALMELWGFYDKDYCVPTDSEIGEALKQTQLDLGGALKGYAGQECADLLKELDVDCAILNLGGNIQTYGSKPGGEPWQIGIQNPEGGGSIGILSVEGTVSIVTSGDYQRYFEENGKKYHHILDPETGYPVESGLRSVTVIGRDGMTADALSTALFVMGLEEAAEFWRESEDFDAVFVLSDGQVFATEGAHLSGCVYEVIRREE